MISGNANVFVEGQSVFWLTLMKFLFVDHKHMAYDGGEGRWEAGGRRGSLPMLT